MAVHHALAADLVLINGRVFTMDAHDTVAQAVAVRDGKIVAVGATAAVEPLVGTVVKDPVTGEPTGELRERAQFLVKRRDGAIDPDTLAERIAVELGKCAHRGVTCIHDIIITKEEVQAYQLLARAGRLPVRVH